MCRLQGQDKPRWDTGIHLGVRLHTTEKIIGTPQGVVVVQSINRKPSDQQWHAELIEKLVGMPWAPNPSKSQEARDFLELPEPVAFEVEQPDVEVQPVQPDESEPNLISKESILDKLILTSLATVLDARHAHIFELVLTDRVSLIQKSVA